jgi:Tol biopolymer transport system component
MTPERIAALISQFGQPVTFQRTTGTTTQVRHEVVCQAIVRGYEPVQLIGSITQGDRQVTICGSYEQPFWSPDGQRIAVSAILDEPHHRIYIMDAGGSNLQPIHQPEGDDNVHPAWSPDGRSIVFTSGKDANGSLYAFDMA